MFTLSYVNTRASALFEMPSFEFGLTKPKLRCGVGELCTAVCRYNAVHSIMLAKIVKLAAATRLRCGKKFTIIFMRDMYMHTFTVLMELCLTFVQIDALHLATGERRHVVRAACGKIIVRRELLKWYLKVVRLVYVIHVLEATCEEYVIRIHIDMSHPSFAKSIGIPVGLSCTLADWYVYC
jgi:hypothetical protein